MYIACVSQGEQLHTGARQHGVRRLCFMTDISELGGFFASVVDFQDLVSPLCVVFLCGSVWGSVESGRGRASMVLCLLSVLVVVGLGLV